MAGAAAPPAGAALAAFFALASYQRRFLQRQLVLLLGVQQN